MHSSSLLYTVLLVSASVKDIDCLPTLPTTTSKLAPHAKNAVVKLTSGGSSSRAFSSYRGPVIPETGKEAVAIVDAKKGVDHKAVSNLRDSGLYSKVHAVLHPNVEGHEVAKFKDFQAASTRNKWETNKGPFMQSSLNVLRAGEAHSARAAALHEHIHRETKHVDVYDLTKSASNDVKKVVDGIKTSERNVNTVKGDYYTHLEQHKPKGTVHEQAIANLQTHAPSDAELKAQYKVMLAKKHPGETRTTVNDRHEMGQPSEAASKHLETTINVRHDLKPASSLSISSSHAAEKVESNVNDRHELVPGKLVRGSSEHVTTNVNDRHDLVPSASNSKYLNSKDGH